MFIRIAVLSSLVVFLGLSACTNSIPEEHPKKKTDQPTVTGVSVWDRISTRSEPLRSSRSTTLLSLGETFTYLDSSAIDSAYNNTEFLKARLSDSSEVWVYGFASVLNAKPGAIKREIPLYLRPDLLTITSTRMEAMEIVAVTDEWDDWIKITGEKKEKRGWIKKEDISYDGIDLAFSLLAKRSLEEEDQEQKIKNIEELIENNPYPNTVFISELTDRLNEERQILREQEDERDRDDEDWSRRRD